MSVFCIEIRCKYWVQSICRGERRSKSQTDLQHPLSSAHQQQLHLVPEPGAATRAPQQTPGSGSGQNSACRKLLLFCHHSETHQISRKDTCRPEFLIPVERGSSCRSCCWCCPGLHHTLCLLLDQVKIRIWCKHMKIKQSAIRNWSLYSFQRKQKAEQEHYTSPGGGEERRTFLQLVCRYLATTVVFNHMLHTNMCFALLSDKSRPRVWRNHRSSHGAECRLQQQHPFPPGGCGSSLQHGPASSAATGKTWTLRCCQSEQPLRLNKHLMAFLLISLKWIPLDIKRFSPEANSGGRTLRSGRGWSISWDSPQINHLFLTSH